MSPNLVLRLFNFKERVEGRDACAKEEHMTRHPGVGEQGVFEPLKKIYLVAVLNVRRRDVLRGEALHIHKGSYSCCNETLLNKKKRDP